MINEIIGHMHEKAFNNFDTIPLPPHRMSEIIDLMNNGELSGPPPSPLPSSPPTTPTSPPLLYLLLHLLDYCL